MHRDFMDSPAVKSRWGSNDTDLWMIFCGEL